MHIKIFNKSRKSQRFSGYPENKIGKVLSIVDRDDKPIRVGDKVQYQSYEGRVLYNPAFKCYVLGLSYSMWYGDNEFDIKSYGKCIDIPMDNGGKNDLVIIDIL